MAATLDELRAARAALLAARASGVRSTRDATGEELHWKSDSEMAAALRALDSEIAAMVGQTPRPRFIQASYSKGLD